MSYHDVVEVLSTKKFYKQAATILLISALIGGILAIIYSPLTLWLKIASISGIACLLGGIFFTASYMVDRQITVRWEWENAFLALLFVVCVLSVGFLVRSVVADHTVRYYFIDSPANASPCVMGFREWGTNDRVACSEDISKLLPLLDRLNESIKKK